MPRPSTDIVVNGKSYELRYGVMEVAWFENQRNGKGIVKVIDGDGLGVNVVALLLVAGIRHMNKRITVESMLTEVAQHIESGQGNLLGLIRPLMKALKVSGIINTDDDEENLSPKSEG